MRSAVQELDALVAKVVRAMLFKAHQKPGLLVKRDELVDLIKVMQSCDSSSRGWWSSFRHVLLHG